MVPDPTRDMQATVIEGPEDMYCFRCSDRETGVSSDVFVHVDILWDDFSAKLGRRFQRPVFMVYRRDGEDQDRAVQSEANFEDLCEYLDDTQLQTLPVEIRTLRQKRDHRRVPGDGPADGGIDSEQQLSAAEVLGGYGGPVPRDRLTAGSKPGQAKLVRPSTAGPRAGASNRPSTAGRQQKYGALQKPKAAWEGAGKEPASPRKRRTAQNTMGGFDKETMMDRITGLQRQLTEMTDERKQMLAESMRLQKELSKVLLENEQLFKVKGGTLFTKVGASSNEVHVMKNRIKALEAEKLKIQKEMADLRTETKVTRLTELEVEKNTYLAEVRRLQAENKAIEQEKENLREELRRTVKADDNDMNYNKVYDMYEKQSRALDEVKREALKLKLTIQEAAEDKRLAEDERDKLKTQLIRARQAVGNKGEGRAAPAREWKEKEEALLNQIKELRQVQKRLDLALARANRERDSAEMERADKDADLKRLMEQKRALQMQLHSLGAGARGGGPQDGGHMIARSDMICFFCQEPESNHVEVQFVDFRVSYRDFCDILKRLYARTKAVAFSYTLNGEEVVVLSEEDFTRCKEVVEDRYCGHGDQALLVTVVEPGALSSAGLDSRTMDARTGKHAGPPDGGSALPGRGLPTVTSPHSMGNSSVNQEGSLMALDTSHDFGVKGGMAAAAARQSEGTTHSPWQGTKSSQAAVQLTFACYIDSDKHLGDVVLPDKSPWHDMRARLSDIAGYEATFSFPDPADPDSRVQVHSAEQWGQCLDIFRKHRDDLQDHVLEIDLVHKASAATASQGPSAQLAGAASRGEVAAVSAVDETCEDADLQQEGGSAAVHDVADDGAADVAEVSAGPGDGAHSDDAAARDKPEEERRRRQAEMEERRAAAAEEEAARKREEDTQAALKRDEEVRAAEEAARKRDEAASLTSEVDDYGDEDDGFEQEVEEEAVVVSGGETGEGMRDAEDAAEGVQEDYREEFDDDVATGDEAAEAVDEDEGDSFALPAGDESNGVYSDNEFDDDVVDDDPEDEF